MSAKKDNKRTEKRHDMRQLPRPGEIYKHFKGNCYRIITVATHTETDEKLVIYQALYGDFGIYARELTVFMEPVDKEKYPNVAQNLRFELLKSGAAAPVLPKKVSEADHTAAEKNVEAKVETPETKTPVMQTQSFKKEAEPQIHPMVLAYLDAGTSKEKLQILTSMKDRLTDSMINTMAIAIDVDIKDGDITERYEELKYCLATRERFEGRRLR